MFQRRLSVYIKAPPGRQLGKVRGDEDLIDGMIHVHRSDEGKAVMRYLISVTYLPLK